MTKSIDILKNGDFHFPKTNGTNLKPSTLLFFLLYHKNLPHNFYEWQGVFGCRLIVQNHAKISANMI